MSRTPAPAVLWGEGHDQARPPSDLGGDEGLAGDRMAASPEEARAAAGGMEMREKVERQRWE